MGVESTRCWPGQRRASRVLLISPPWRLVNWPSLALGVLKAHLTRIGIPTDGLHLHFEVAMRLGLARYQTIASGWELGEAMYFGLYSPEEAPEILSRTAQYSLQNGHPWPDELGTIAFMREVERATVELLDEIDLSQYNLVGLSVGALQLGASLYLAKLLKTKDPALRVVLGGGGVLGQPGAALLKLVPWIDAVVDGEGESALASLARPAAWDEKSLLSIPNLRYRRSDGSIGRTQTAAMANLNDASLPDMDEFYAAARRVGYPPDNLVMPVEASRGCQWEHRKNDGQLHGCTFCGLYRNSPNFREKRSETILAEIRGGVARSQATAVSFVDAYLPASCAKDLLRDISSGGLDITLFCELRCDLDAEMADLLARAGTRQVQLGVEALHTRILGKMAKGTRMIDNVFSIKLCEEYGIPHQFNLITRFPGVVLQDLREMIQFLPSLQAFEPPTLADFYLDRGSRIFAEPARYGIHADSLDRSPLPFLPLALIDQPVNQFVTFEAEASDEMCQSWSELEALVATWRANHDEAKEQGIDHLLSYRDLGDVALITDYRNGQHSILELAGIGRAVLLACDRLIRKKELEHLLPELDPQTLDSVLDTLRSHQLIIEEGGSLLGLPVRSPLPNGAPRVWSAKV